MNAFSRLLITTIMISLALSHISNSMDSKQAFEQIKEITEGWGKNKLSRILIVPIVHINANSISTDGYGELTKDEAQSFAKNYRDSEKKILSTSLDQGLFVNIYFLHEGRGFRKEDVWMCKIHKNDVIAIFPVDDGRIYIKFPEQAAKIIATHFIQKIEK